MHNMYSIHSSGSVGTIQCFFFNFPRASHCAQRYNLLTGWQEEPQNTEWEQASDTSESVVFYRQKYCFNTAKI